MEKTDKPPQIKKIKKSYVTWSNFERHLLVDTRILKDNWFCGKNANSNEGWKKIASELRCQLTDDKDAVSCKTQWNSLIKKYKSFFKYQTGEGTGEEAVTEEAKDWEFFDKIHTYAAKKDNYHPPFLIDSCDGVVSMQTKSQSPLLPISIREESSSSSSPLNIDDPSSSSVSTPTGILKTRNEFLRLEQHIKKRDKKIGKKISSLLAVFGQMVQTDYPHIDTSALMLSSDSESN